MSTTPKTLNDWLESIRTTAKNEREKGELFEKLVRAYLLADPTYAGRIENVWLYRDWPDRPESWHADNTGIDLVARTRDGEYWAIQCKFYEAGPIDKGAVDSFISDSQRPFTVDGEKEMFSYRLLVVSVDELGRKAEEAVANLEDIGVLYLREMARAEVDWSTLSLTRGTLKRRGKKTPREHQKEAVEAVVGGFDKNDRGQLIMACGTGKTYVSLLVAERLLEKSKRGTVLFLAPSIALVAQALREWAEQKTLPMSFFAVCSDRGVDRAEEDTSMRAAELAYPATTDAKKLAPKLKNAPGIRVVFATYQSVEVARDALREAGLEPVDLVICDEAHRTTGVEGGGHDGQSSAFVLIHKDDFLRAKKRLYMTATPRIYGERTRRLTEERGVPLNSMDDPGIYGPELYVLRFDKAVEMQILSDYRVVIVVVDDETIAGLANAYEVGTGEEKKGITTELVTMILGTWKGLANRETRRIGEGGELAERLEGRPLRRAIGFARSIRASQDICGAFERIVGLARQQGVVSGGVSVEVHHVDGTMGMGRRLKDLDWLKSAGDDEDECRLLTNARCLGEGVDVPALDAIVFFHPRDSIVDVVQAVGRVMRRAEGKDYGYIILPVALPKKHLEDYEHALEDDPRFGIVWKVLRALRAHDERLVDRSEYIQRITVIDGRGGPAPVSRKGREKRERVPVLAPDLPPVPIEEIRRAILTVTPKKLGDLDYWEDWAKDTAEIAARVTERIRELCTRGQGRTVFQSFLTALRANLNPTVREEDAYELLAQHVLTLPIFAALFPEASFGSNPVSEALAKVLEEIERKGVGEETGKLEVFYRSVRRRAALAKSDEARQELIRRLYDTFFRTAFERTAARVGIVYTPVEIVDFILRGSDALLRTHFKRGLASKGVHVLDPFTGTGTFVARLLQNRDLIPDEDLARKYSKELHANEIVLLAYYVASVNIEAAYHARKGTHELFPGIVLTDTFQLGEDRETGDFLKPYFEANSERARKQKALPVIAIVGNPPYSVGQKHENDDNQNPDYPTLDGRIGETYAKGSTAKLMRNLYDSYIRAFRWASDRIGDQGVVGFVTNGSFLTAASMDGFRKALQNEFSEVYVLNLRGNLRLRGQDLEREGGNVFGQATRTPIAITFLVKRPGSTGGRIYYRDVGESLKTEDKLAFLREADVTGKDFWTEIRPDADGNWLLRRSEEYGRFVPLGQGRGRGKNDTRVFGIQSLGVLTARDAWCVNHDRMEVENNIKRMLAVYEREREKYRRSGKGRRVEGVVTLDPREIAWTRGLKSRLSSDTPIVYEAGALRSCAYRPFVRKWMYFHRYLNERVYQIPRLFPTGRDGENFVIAVCGQGNARDFSCLATTMTPDYHYLDGQCYPLYVYEPARGDAEKAVSGDLNLREGDDESYVRIGGYVRKPAITGKALEIFRERYGDPGIRRLDIFHYVYGILHSPEYRERYRDDLLIEGAPRIPLVDDFVAFRDAGKELMDLHTGYATLEPWPLEKRSTGGAVDYRVEKMKIKDGVIVYNERLVLAGIPPEAWDYVVNGQSALWWVVNQFRRKEDKRSGLVDDPNAILHTEGEEAIVDLIGRVVRVSVETVRIVKGLPPLGAVGAVIP